MVIGLLALAGCGGSSGGTDAPADPPRTTAPQAEANGTAPGTVIFFRRYRYAGATVSKLTISRSGKVTIDKPSGGAGRGSKTGRLSPASLRQVERDVAAIHWSKLSPRKRRLDGSGGYYLITRGADDVTAMASGMSEDLIPLVRRLNRVLDDPRNTSTFKYYSPS